MTRRTKFRRQKPPLVLCVTPRWTVAHSLANSDKGDLVYYSEGTPEGWKEDHYQTVTRRWRVIRKT